MKIAIKNPSCLVVDNFLPTRQFNEVATFGEKAPLRWANLDVYNKVWSFDDGSPLTSAYVLVGATPRKSKGLRALPTPKGLTEKFRGHPEAVDFRAYPTGTALDKVVAAIFRCHDGLRAWTGWGNGAPSWKTMSARLFVYPPGTSLDWHSTPPGVYCSSFTYYVHPKWKTKWGGELLVCDDTKAGLDEVEGGLFVMPKPNRLVVIKGRNMHKLCKVTSLAGENPRRAVTGFFHYSTVEESAEYAESNK